MCDRLALEEPLPHHHRFDARWHSADFADSQRLEVFVLEEKAGDMR